MTPYHIWMRRTPNLAHLRLFGAEYWYTLPSKNLRKLDCRARLAVMVGYSTASKGYKRYDQNLKKIIVSRSVRFIEMDSSPQSEHSSIHGRFDTGTGIDITEISPSEYEQMKNKEVDQNLTALTDSESSSTSANGREDAPRRSSRIQRAPGELWKATSHAAHIAIGTCNTAASASESVPGNYAEAVSTSFRDMWPLPLRRRNHLLLGSIPGRSCIALPT